MKLKKNIFPILFLACLFVACSNKPFDNHNENQLTPPSLTTTEYFELLNKDQYMSLGLPEFTPADIPALLKYGQDQTVIYNYPVNPISSYKGSQNNIGFLVLWTIENIRKNYPYQSGRSSIQNYPSQNPVILSQSATSFLILQDEVTLTTVYDHYQQWWDEHGSIDFESAKIIDPLGETNFRWK